MSYAGRTATIVAGQGGFNGAENIDSVPITDLIDATNIRYDGDAWRKVGGLTALDANAVGNVLCLGGHDWWPNTSAQRQITAWNSGVVYKELSGNMDAVELVNSLSLNTSPSIFVDAGREIVGNPRKLIMFSQGQIPQVLNADANVMANIANPSIDWSGSLQPSGAIMHDGRLVAWMQDNIYFSALNDHENFLRYDPADSASDPMPSFTIAAGQGDEIRACYSLGTTRLYIFKYPIGIYFIDTTYVTSYFMPVTTVRDDIGIAGTGAITKVGSLGTWFIGSDGHIYSLNLIENPDVDAKDASITSQLNLNKFIKDNINPSRLKWARLNYDPIRKEVVAAYTETGDTSNNLLIVIDIRDPSRPKISLDNRGTYYNAMWRARDTVSQFLGLHTAGTAGLVYKMNQSARAVSAAGYIGTLRIVDTDFSWYDPNIARLQKRFDFIELNYTTTGPYPLYIDTFIDGQYYQTYSATQLNSGGLLGSFVLGTDVLGGTGLAKLKLKIGGIGTRFGFRLRNDDVNEDFNVSKAVVSFDVLGATGEV